MPAKARDKNDKRDVSSDYEDVTTQTLEVFQKEDNLWYWVVRDDKGNVIKEWTRGSDTEAEARSMGESMFGEIGTKTTNRSRKYKSRPQ